MQRPIANLGEFLVAPVLFCGPCNKSPNVEIRGTLKAHTDLSAFKDATWLEFKDLSSLNITRAGTDNGIRVKTWPGSPPSKASNLTFEDIIMTNVKNPIIIDQEYCLRGEGSKTKPSQVKISDVLFKNIRGTATTKSEVTLVCSSSMAYENVVLANIDLKYIFPDGPATSTCANVKGISKTGMENPQPCS
ncbi:hypothetical protein IFM89_009576 [Coptis chinensis]|uniref:Polygalacturonase n=1 Tax=Coptis chinensis TaxID=261450 RepID=A0A835M5E0_9MAGN|nr:hypothetical protein IFM89_009576 [Coptis chinensis]